MKTKINNARRLLPCWLRVMVVMMLCLQGVEAFTQIATFGAPGVPGSVSDKCGPIARLSASSAEDYSQHYYLYTAADMAAAGILPGSTITGIAWYKANNGATTAGNNSSRWMVHMKNSSTVPSPTWCNPSYAVQSAGATLVYNNIAQTIPSTIGWLPLTLTTPFVYTGGSLEVGSSWNCSLFTGNPTTNGISWNEFSLPNINQTFGARGPSSGLVMINESCSPISQLVFTSPSCTAPNPGLTISSTVTSCFSTPFVLSLQNPTPGAGVTYLWESADDINFTTNVTSLGTSSTETVTATTGKWYRCQVTCANGPITGFSVPLFVDLYDPILVYASGTDLYCHGDNQGEVHLSTSGGTAPYTYDWNSGTYSTSSIINLFAGSYSVIVTDANGCTANTGVTLSEPSALVYSSTVTNVSPAGASNGAIQVNASGGVAPYNYSKDAGVNYQASNLFSGLPATLYPMRIQDANGCITAYDETVGNPVIGVINTNIYFDISEIDDTMPHLVWGIPSSLNATGMMLERSFDGVNFVQIANSPAIGLPDVNTLPPGSFNPNGTILFGNEQGPRFIYNDPIGGLNSDSKIFYRVRLFIAGSTVPVYSVVKKFLPPFIAIYPWPIINPAPCPPIGFPPLGFQATPFLSTQQIGCCLVTKRLYRKFGCATASPCVGKDCIPACNCTYDPCCVHNCAQKNICGCGQWVSCGVATLYQWVVVAVIQTPLPISTTQTNVSCNGGSNGSITIAGSTQFCKRNKIIGAPACFAMTHPLPWPNALGQISNTFTGLCAGCYTIQVRDCNGCVGTKVVCITQPPAISLTATSVNSCNCTGSITVNATGGTPCPAPNSYTYQMLPTGVVQNSNTFNNLCAGCYTIKVTDCNGCTKTIVKCVTGSSFNLTPTLVHPCLGSNTGSICIHGGALTPNPCLKYSIGSSCATIATAVYTSNPCFNNLAAGTYCIKIKDTCNNCDTCICVTLGNITVPCAKTNSLVVNTGYDPITGLAIVPAGVNDPLWTVTPVGGGIFGPVQTVNIPAWATNPNAHAIGFTGGPAGPRTYRRSFKLCSCDTITFNLNIAYDNWLNGIYIDGILVTIPNTITPFAQWGNPANFTMFHNYTFKKYLCAGTHTLDVVVVNLGGPTGMNLVGTVASPSNSIVTNTSPVNCCCVCVAPQVNAIVTNASCNSNTGSICVVPTTPVVNPCLKYQIGTSCTNLSATSQTNPCFTNLAPGNYCVKITDTCLGCDTCICVTVGQNSNIQISTTASGTCTCTGTITVSTNITGCPTGTVTYQILPTGAPQTSNVFTGLCPGCYTIQVTDCNGCTATIVECVPIIGYLFNLTPFVTGTGCNGVNSGSVCITNSTGVLDPCLKFKIGNTCTSAGAYTSNPCFNGLAAGNYCIHVYDTCTGCDTCICVNVPAYPALQLTATSVGTCACTGSITVNVAGGLACPLTGYTYQILPSGLTQASNTFTNLCPGCYTIIVTDCYGCTASIVHCVTGSSGPTGLVPLVNHVSCNGGNNGSICISNITPVINPCLKYALANTNCQVTAASVYTSNPCFNNLPAGNYCIKIKDTCTNCDTCICVTVNQPTPIVLTATSVNTCSCTGSVTVVVAGGTPCTPGGYTYQLLPAGAIQNSPTFNNLCAGCYTIKVTDCNGCTATIVKCVIGIGGPTGLVPTVNHVTCNGANNGSICISNSTGVTNPCLKYALANTNCQVTAASVYTSNPCFNNLPAGNYCIKIKDTCTNCDTCICVTVNQPTPIVLTATSVNTCSCTGSVTVFAAGGTPCTPGGYTYQLLPAGAIQNSPTFNNLCAGCYTIKVTDCNGCTATIVKCVIGVGGPTGLVPTVNHVTCNGANNGSICISNSTGVTNPCLKYALANTNCQVTAASVYTSNPCFNNLPAGNYCIKIKDTCTNCDTCICVTVNQPTPIVLTATSVNTCSCTGSVTVVAAGGTPCTPGGYTYQLLPAGAIQNSPTFNNLCAGCYTIKVTDCNGCTATIVKCVIGIGGPTGLVPTVNHVTCNGANNGSICISNSTGVTNPCLKYALANTNCQVTAASVYTSNPCFNNLPAGNYCIKIKDTCTNCDTCICVTVNQPTPIVLTATSVNTCSCTGSVTVFAAGGTPCTPGGYTYQLLPAGAIQNSPTFNNLCAGCYTIKVTDCNGCTATIVKCVIGIGGPTGLVPTVNHVTCNGANNGSICISNSTGVTNPCLKYALANTNCQVTAASVYTSNPCFNNLPAGNYCIKIKDTCTNCDTCICVTVNQPTPIVLTATSVNTCSCTGSVTVVAAGGTPCTPGGYTYQLLPAGAIQNSPTFNNLCAGCYTIKVTDCNGCTATIVKCVIGIGGPTGLVPTVNHVTCNGANNGSICISNTTGVTNPCLKYALANTNCQVTAASVYTSNPCFNNLPAGNYCIKIKDTCTNCDTCICVTVNQPTPIVLTATSVNTCSCTGSVTVFAAGGTPCTPGGYTYQLLPAGAIQNSPTFNNLCAGCYTIKVTDCNGCTATIVKCVIGIGGPTGLVPTVNHVTCNGANNGSICISNSTGVTNPCLKYALANTNCQVTAASVYTSNPCFNNLPAGNYCIKIKDTCTNCDTCICVTVNQPTPIVLTATSVNTCSCTGSITVVAAGGTPCTPGGYTYQLLPAGAIQNSPTFNNLCAGCYTIKVTDCNGCTASIVKCVIGVGGPTGLVPTVNHVTCNGANNGSICITNTTGVTNPCLKYALANTNCQVTATSVYTSNPCFQNLPAGNYCIKIKDTCTNCDTCICVTVNQLPSFNLVATSVTACPCNSSITVGIVGATVCPAGSYTYQILPSGLVQNSPTFNNLCQGCYTIIATDCNGCTASVVKCVGPCGGVIINVGAILQGYHVGAGIMTPALFNQGVSSNNNIADEISVELHSPNPPFQLIASTTTTLSINGFANCQFNTVSPGMYYIALKHRNSIQTWSANPVPLSAVATTYNFTTSAAQAYGNNMVQVAPNKWALYAGDINQDENVDLTDISLFEIDALNFAFGYLSTDITGDGTVDLSDFPLLDLNANNFIFSNHP
jgi:hypothetical protein